MVRNCPPQLFVGPARARSFIILGTPIAPVIAMLGLLLTLALQDPLTTEPIMPESVDPKDKQYVKLPRGGYIQMGKNAAGKPVPERLVLPGEVVIQRGVIEVFVCGVGGKDYESALRAPCDIHEVDMSLALLGLKKGKVPELATQSDPEGSRVLVLAQWTDDKGKTVTYRAEDLVRDVAKNAPMPRVGWTYVAAWEEECDPMTGQPTGRKILAAGKSKSLCTTYRDASALFDNPLRKIAAVDTAFNANGDRLPDPGTKIRLIIRLPSEAELAEIKKVEEQLAKDDK